MRHQKIFVVGPEKSAACWIDGPNVHKIEKATLVLFTGGVDISPSIYGKAPHPMTQDAHDHRDEYEKAMFNEALELNLPMLGLCRGSQLLCALSGGILVQHSNHPARHEIITSEDVKFSTNSCHHQRAYPFVEGCEHKLLAWAPYGLSSFNEGESREDDMTGKPEAEVVFYPKTKALGIQGHPEWMWPVKGNMMTEVMNYYRGLVDSLCEEKL